MATLLKTLRGAYPLPILAWDLGVFAIAAIAGWATRNEIGSFQVSTARVIALTTSFALIHLVVGAVTGLYSNRWKTASFAEAVRVTGSWGLASVSGLAFNLAFLSPRVPQSVVLFQLVSALLLLLAGRGVWRLMSMYQARPDSLGRKRLAIYGAGERGQALVDSIRSDPLGEFTAVALLDDDPMLKRRTIGGLQVVGGASSVSALRDLADVLIISTPEVGPERIEEISQAASTVGLEVLVMPSASEMLGMLATVRDARPIDIGDLLGRPEVDINYDAVRGYISGARVLVTGAGGSIGSELARQIALLSPAALYLLDRDETGLQQLQIEIFGHGLLNDPGLVLADIRDEARILEVFAQVQPDVVMHAAALKHLPLLEAHPTEGFATNVFGTRNVLNAAAATGVRHFVNVSTDKAAEPTSVLGSTKLLAEALTVGTGRRSNGTYVSVRFGNVLGSRGSVLPTFERQLAAGGPLTVTHPDVTRYFMSIPEAARLILQAGAIGENGETMLLEMGEPVRIVDLARRLIAHRGAHATIEFTGLRPNEKLHEDLIAAVEHAHPGPHPLITHVKPSHRMPTQEDLREIAETPGSEMAAALLTLTDRLKSRGQVTAIDSRKKRDAS